MERKKNCNFISLKLESVYTICYTLRVKKKNNKKTIVYFLGRQLHYRTLEKVLTEFLW